MLKPYNEDLLALLALALPLCVRLYAEGAELAGQRLVLMALTLLVAYAWAVLFARRTGRPIGPGLVYSAVLFVLLLPGPVAWGGAVFAISFGTVFGREIFGGKAILPPALIGLAFAIFSFPTGGFEAQQVLSQAIDPAFAVSCLPGAALLIWKRALAWRVAVGAVLGLAAASLMMGYPAWWEQLGMGTFAAGILFLAAAPEGASRLKSARWMHGVLVGALVIVIRLSSPEQSDGVIFAALLAGLFAPLLDRVLDLVLGRVMAWRLRHG